MRLGLSNFLNSKLRKPNLRPTSDVALTLLADLLTDLQHQYHLQRLRGIPTKGVPSHQMQVMCDVHYKPKPPCQRKMFDPSVCAHEHLCQSIPFILLRFSEYKLIQVNGLYNI